MSIKRALIITLIKRLLQLIILSTVCVLFIYMHDTLIKVAEEFDTYRYIIIYD